MEIRLLSADDAIAYWGDRYLDEEYMVFHVKTSYTTEIQWIEAMEKSVLDFSVQDASAALPQNCQTT